MNCAQVKERLIDFLYDELPPETRGSFTEHLNGCAACKAEVASYQQTLGSARVALGGPLNQEPPARVHLAAVEAAKAASKQATAIKARPPGPRDELGFFARLWRTPWFLPAFGAASVATVVFLVRVLKNPEVLPGQRPHSIEERALATPEPVAPPEARIAAHPAAIPAAEVKAKAESDHGKASGSARSAGKRATSGAAAPDDIPTVPIKKSKKAVSEDPLSGLKLEGGPSSSGGQGRFAEPPPPRPAAAKSGNKSLDNLLGDFGEKERTQRRAQPASAPAGGKADRIVSDHEDAFDGPSAAASAPVKKAPRPEPAAEMAKTTVHSVTRAAGAPALTASSSYAPAPAPTARTVRDYPAAPVAETAPSAPPPVARHRGEKKAEEMLEGSEQEDSKSLAKDKAPKGESKPGPTLDESVRKAERLYASQDWNAAAAAYRDLLNRFPNHKDAPKWRERLNEAVVAEEQRQAKIKKAKAKTTGDALDGLKL